MKAGREREQAAVLIAVAGLADGRTVGAAVTPRNRESVESWSAVLRDLRERGIGAPRLGIGDGPLGIGGALRHVWPEADEQRWWNHQVLHVLEQLPCQRHGAAKPMLRALASAPTRAEAERTRKAFEEGCSRHGDAKAAEALGRSGGADGALLPGPEGALGAPADDHCRGVAAGGAAAADGMRRSGSRRGNGRRR